MNSVNNPSVSFDTYTCAACGETFVSGWSEEEALAELKANFGNIPKEDCSVVCDDCFKRMF